MKTILMLGIIFLSIFTIGNLDKRYIDIPGHQSESYYSTFTFYPDSNAIYCREKNELDYHSRVINCDYKINYKAV